jgi:hypothetical protein
MWQMYVPLQSHIAKLGHDYEAAKTKFEHYAANNHDPTDLLSAFVYANLMSKMDEARKALSPHSNEWCCARNGYSLN